MVTTIERSSSVKVELTKCIDRKIEYQPSLIAALTVQARYETDLEVIRRQRNGDIVSDHNRSYIESLEKVGAWRIYFGYLRPAKVIVNELLSKMPESREKLMEYYRMVRQNLMLLHGLEIKNEK